MKALEEVGLGNQFNKKPSEMSGGQMQRVAIARAIVNNPDIILADEPTGALDTTTSVQVMDLLKKMRNWGLTQITIKILKYRKKFRKRWQDMWLDCLFEVKRRGDVKNVGERILETWTLLYAVVKCLHECGLQTPIDEKKLFDVCISSMIRQQELLHHRVQAGYQVDR